MKNADRTFLFQGTKWYVPRISDLRKAISAFAEFSGDPGHACWCSGTIESCTMKCETCILCSNLGDPQMKIRVFLAYCAEKKLPVPRSLNSRYAPDIPSGVFHYGNLTFKVPAIQDRKRLAEEYQMVMKHPGGDVCFCKHDVVQDCSGIVCRECILCAYFGDFSRRSAAFRAFCRVHKVELPVVPITLFDRTIRFLWQNRIFTVPPLRKIPEMIRQFVSSVEESARSACWCHNDVAGECDSRQCESCLLCSNAGEPLKKIRAFQEFCRCYGIELPEVHPVLRYDIPHQEFEFHGKKYFVPDIMSREKLLEKYLLEMENSPQSARFCGGMATVACIGSHCDSCLLSFQCGNAREKYQAFMEFGRINGLAIPEPAEPPCFDKAIEECFYSFEGHEFHIPSVFDEEVMIRQYRKVFAEGNTGKWCEDNTSGCDRNCTDCLLGNLTDHQDLNLRAFQTFCREHDILLPEIGKIDFTPEIPRCSVTFEGVKYQVPDIMSREKLVEEYTAALAGNIMMECWCRNNVTRSCNGLNCDICLLCTNQGQSEPKLRAFREFASRHGILLPRKDDDDFESPPEKAKDIFFPDDDELFPDDNENAFAEDDENSFEPEIMSTYFDWKDKIYHVPDIFSMKQTLNEYREAMFHNPDFSDWCLADTRDSCSKKRCGECILFSGNDPLRKISAFQAFCRKNRLPFPDTGLSLVPEISEGVFIYRGKRFYVPELFDCEASVKRFSAVLREKPFARGCVPDDGRKCARLCDLCLFSTSGGNAVLKIEAFRTFCRANNLLCPELAVPEGKAEIPGGVFVFEGTKYPFPPILSKSALEQEFDGVSGWKLRETRWCGNGACGNCESNPAINCKECLFSTEGCLAPGKKLRAFLEFCKIQELHVPELCSQVYEPMIESGEYQAEGETFIIPALSSVSDTLASFRRGMSSQPLNSCWCMATEYDFCPKDCNQCLLCTNSGRSELKLTLFKQICRENGIRTGVPDGIPLDFPPGEFVWKKHTFRYPGIADSRILVSNFEEAMKRYPLTGIWCREGAAGECDELCEECLLCANAGPSRLKIAAFTAFCREKHIDLPDTLPEISVERKAGSFKYRGERFYVPEIADSSRIADSFSAALCRLPNPGRWCQPDVRGECNGQCEECIFMASHADLHRKIGAFLAFCRENGYDAGPPSFNPDAGFDHSFFHFEEELYRVPTVMDTRLMVKQYAEAVSHNLFSASWCHNVVPHCCGVNCNECLLCTNIGNAFVKLRAFRKFCSTRKIALPRIRTADSFETAEDKFIYKDKCYYMPPLVSVERMIKQFSAIKPGNLRAKWCSDVVVNCDNISCSACLLCAVNEDPDVKIEAFFAWCLSHDVPPPK